MPDGVPAYTTCGDDDARAFARRPPHDLDRARALFVNRREARQLTGHESAEDSAARLGECVPIAVVTCGAEGAVAAVDGELLRAQAFPTRAVDTTGAGDLLCAAFVWADLAGADPQAALTGSTDLAIRALALHPLVPSVSVARRIFAGYRERLPELQERFAA